MINLSNYKCLPAYTTRKIVKQGLLEPNTLCKYNFSAQDRILLNSGALKLVPFNMLNLIVTNNAILNGELKEAGTIMQHTEFEENTLKVLVRSGILQYVFKDEFSDYTEEEIVKYSLVYNYEGKTFKDVSKFLNIPIEVLKKEFNLKQGLNNKKVKYEDLSRIAKIVLAKEEQST